jgi:hypothetical protein
MAKKFVSTRGPAADEEAVSVLRVLFAQAVFRGWRGWLAERGGAQGAANRVPSPSHARAGMRSRSRRWGACAAAAAAAAATAAAPALAQGIVPLPRHLAAASLPTPQLSLKTPPCRTLAATPLRPFAAATRGAWASSSCPSTCPSSLPCCPASTCPASCVAARPATSSPPAPLRRPPRAPSAPPAAPTDPAPSLPSLFFLPAAHVAQHAHGPARSHLEGLRRQHARRRPQ